jgi:hypothetical protein
MKVITSWKCPLWNSHTKFTSTFSSALRIRKANYSTDKINTIVKVCFYYKQCSPDRCDYYKTVLHSIFFSWLQKALSRPDPLHYRGFTSTLKNTTLSRTPLDSLSVQHTETHYDYSIKCLSAAPCITSTVFTLTGVIFTRLHCTATPQFLSRNKSC